MPGQPKLFHQHQLTLSAAYLIERSLVHSTYFARMASTLRSSPVRVQRSRLFALAIADAHDRRELGRRHVVSRPPPIAAAGGAKDPADCLEIGGNGIPPAL
jgi:hypothetical protein